MTDDPLLEVRNLKKHYPIRRGVLNRQVGAAKAVDGISFEVRRGETLGLVGESGCGKSTAATSIVRLEDPTSGEVIFNGGDRAGATRGEDGVHPNDVTRFDKAELKAFRRNVQMVFQDPSSSFDPRMTVGGSVAEMLLVHGMTDKGRRRAIVEDLLDRVGLSAEDYDRYPHEFSGGQKQRIALARALVLNPDLVVADEPVSALDVSVKAEILSLISDLQAEFGLSLLLISHDMSIIREVCDRVAVMYLGKIVEIGDTDEVFANPQHPYTEALLSSIPEPDPRAKRDHIDLTGTVPDPVNPPSGCRFHTRCQAVIQPDGLDIDQDHYRAVMGFRDRLRRGDVDVEAARELVAAESDVPESEVADADIDRALREEFDLPGELGDPDADAALTEALDRAIDGSFEAASERLRETFESVCERREPTHLRQEGYGITAEEWEAILSLHGATASGSLDVDGLRGSDGQGASEEALRAEIRSDVGLDGALTDADAEAVVSEAIDAVLTGNQDRASTILYEAFAGEHSSACHLNDETVDATSGPMLAASRND